MRQPLVQAAQLDHENTLARRRVGASHAMIAHTQNHILELDGYRRYVELPSNIFNSLEEVTVAGWVKFDRLGRNARFLDFPGERLRKSFRLEGRRRGQREGAIVRQGQVNATPGRPRFQPTRDIHGGDQPVERLAPMLREESEKLAQLLLELLQL